MVPPHIAVRHTDRRADGRRHLRGACEGLIRAREPSMPITRLDHVTVCTRDVPRVHRILSRHRRSRSPGPRPHFLIRWCLALQQAACRSCIIVDREASAGWRRHRPSGLRSDGPSRLYRDAAGIEQRRVRSAAHSRPGVPQSGTQQLFFSDPDGARIELDFPADECCDGPDTLTKGGATT